MRDRRWEESPEEKFAREKAEKLEFERDVVRQFEFSIKYGRAEYGRLYNHRVPYPSLIRTKSWH